MSGLAETASLTTVSTLRNSNKAVDSEFLKSEWCTPDDEPHVIQQNAMSSLKIEMAEHSQASDK